MIRICAAMPLLSVALLQVTAFAASHMKPPMTNVRPLAVSAEANAEMALYSLRAYENCDPTNAVQALLFTPKPVGMNPLPMVVYIPGNGELGSVARQFRQRAILFRKFDNALLHQTNPISIAQTELNKVMGDGIPATSFAAGRNPIVNVLDGNIELSPDGLSYWPSERIVQRRRQWHHSDICNVAFFYVNFIFHKIVAGESQ